MSKENATWYQLVRVGDSNGVIAYNGATRLYRQWLPTKTYVLAKYLLENFEDLHLLPQVTVMVPSDWEKLPTKAEYYLEDDKVSEPVTSETYNSPNSSVRAGTINSIVLHNTCSSYSSAISWLCNTKAGASAHLVIGRDGKVARLVPDERAAWHAGNRTVNHRSIGIEIEALDTDSGMTAKQEEQVVAWCTYFMEKYGIIPDKVVGHRTIVNTACPILIWKTENDLIAWVNKNLKGGSAKPVVPTKPNGVKESNGFYYFDRDVKANLSKDFTTKEFTCSCGCREQKISVNLVNKLQVLRNKLGEPLNITSGYRCEKHNAAIGGVATSNHVKGLAADTWAAGQSVDNLAANASVSGFTGIGRYYSSRFVHLSVDSNEGYFIGD